jgi:hypothetical protein
MSEVWIKREMQLEDFARVRGTTIIKTNVGKYQTWEALEHKCNYFT